VKKYIDPPQGWKWGFPKEFPEGVADIDEWFVANGYPRSVIKEYGEYFFYRIFWSDDVVD
jgi:hypothetical protein